METLQLIVLALIQGFTEFLPISSSAHLILPSQLFGWPDQGLAFDVALHLGSLSAVITYFYKDLKAIAAAWFIHVFKQRASADSTLAWAIAVGTLPAVFVGWWAEHIVEHFRTLMVIGVTTFVFGILLAVADRKSHTQTLTTVNMKQAFFIGCMQCLALIPGVSRSGITMTAALLANLNREASARFSFLLSIPLIVAAASLKTVELSQSSIQIDWLTLFYGAFLSALTAYMCIKFFIEWIARIGFMPFVIYRMILGVALISVDIYFTYDICMSICRKGI
jgi:undecaprenyl-diphosphatase